MKTVWLMAAGMMMASHGAWAAGIRDLSMSPTEMLQQNMNVNHAPTGGSNLTPDVSGINTNNGMQKLGNVAPIVGTPGQLPSKNYMDGYCDPNFKPLMGRSPQYAGIASCLEQQKSEACKLYQSVPADVKQALDASINCMAQASDAAGTGDAGEDSEGDGWGALPPAQGYAATMAHCGAADTRRLHLLKHYWSDQNLAYALVFVPDLVMDSSGSCLNRR